MIDYVMARRVLVARLISIGIGLLYLMDFRENILVVLRVVMPCNVRDEFYGQQ